MRNLTIVFPCVLLLFFTSCKVNNEITYFKNLNDSLRTVIALSKVEDLKIQPGDVLGITVTTKNADLNRLYNTGELQLSADASLLSKPTLPSGANTLQRDGYLVDNEGNINFPVVGKLKVDGLSKEKLREVIIYEVEKEVNDPIVNVRFLNAAVTVMGDVAHPGRIDISDRKKTVIEALGEAGDMLVTGKRENVLLIRTIGDSIEAVRLNFQDANLITSPYFFLQQNDVIYVEPNETRVRQSKGAPTTLQYVTLGVALVNMVTLIILRVN